MANHVTRQQLTEWGYVEQPDGSWQKPSLHLGRLDPQKHAQPQGALVGGPQAVSRRQNGRKKGDRRSEAAQTTARPRKRRERPLAPVLAVTMTAHLTSLLDDDNLGTALKPIRDEIAEALGVDDGDGSVLWQPRQVLTSSATGVSVVIQPQ